MTEDQFVAAFGTVYEHSPWVAQRTFRRGLTPNEDLLSGLTRALGKTVAAAGREEQLALINAHPDLAGRAAVADELTEASTSEQAAAGIDQCSEAEFARFQELNARYRDRFGFPFIMAVKGSNRHDILVAFEQRIGNDPDTEFHRALKEIDRIAEFRLQALAEEGWRRR